MKQLTDIEKQELGDKIKKEKARQQTLRESNPDLPESFEAASAKRRFVPKYLWKYGFLVIILCLLAFNVMHLLKWRNFAYDQYGGLIITLMCLFNHVAFFLTTKGSKKSVVMKTIACVWTAFGLVYAFWVFR